MKWKVLYTYNPSGPGCPTPQGLYECAFILGGEGLGFHYSFTISNPSASLIAGGRDCRNTSIILFFLSGVIRIPSILFRIQCVSILLSMVCRLCSPCLLLYSLVYECLFIPRYQLHNSLSQHQHQGRHQARPECDWFVGRRLSDFNCSLTIFCSFLFISIFK